MYEDMVDFHVKEAANRLVQKQLLDLKNQKELIDLSKKRK